MKTSRRIASAAALLAIVPLATAAADIGDPEAGAQAFRACAACHALEPGRHMTGPSLAEIWGREAGAAPGFARYSPALAAAEVVWDEETLDAFLADPQGFIPGNRMTFPGIRDERLRADLLAFLEQAAQEAAEDMPGAMIDVPELPDLSAVGPEQRVAAIRYCGDTYYVATADGETSPFWEFNLRFKTDSSTVGPPPGQPVLLPAGMIGDRAFVVFADPAEISAFIEMRC